MIPFSVASAADVLISIAEHSSLVLGTYFDLTVGDAAGNNGTSYDQSPIASNVLGGVSQVVAIPAGVSTLSILENTSAASFGTDGTFDTLAIGIQFQNSIPEPATLSLLGFGAACLMAARRRQRPV